MNPVIAGLGPLGTRYNIPNTQDETQSIVSWKQDNFEGGPEIFVQEPEGKTRLANEGDYKKKAFTASDTAESEEPSSVVSVHDLGFSSAPEVSFHQFSDYHNRWAKNRGNPNAEHVMCLDELRDHLGCKGGPTDRIGQLIEEKIEKSFEKSAMGDEEYLPLDAFEAIFTIETIKSLINETHSKISGRPWQDTVLRIVGTELNQGCRRILGILVLMNRVHYIDRFIEEDIGDCDLPIKRSGGDQKRFKTRAGTENSSIFRCWPRNDIELFYIYQRRLFIPFFDIQENKLCSYLFDASIILPWEDYEQRSSGGNGRVHKVQIHPKHHNFRTSSVRRPDPTTCLFHVG